MFRSSAARSKNNDMTQQNIMFQRKRKTRNEFNLFLSIFHVTKTHFRTKCNTFAELLYLMLLVLSHSFFPPNQKLSRWYQDVSGLY